MAEQYGVLEKKYKALKKKSKVLQDENTTLVNNMEKIKLKAIRLQKERSFLLDRLLRYEDASDEDVSSSNTDEEEEPTNINNNGNVRGGLSIASPNAKAKEAESFPFPGSKAKSEGEVGAKRKKVPPIPQNNPNPTNPTNPTNPPHPKKKKSKTPSDKTNVSTTDPASVCIALGKDKSRTCKSKALAGLQYCWHHAPLDPNSGFIFCQYVDPTKKAQKKCNIPVPKSKSIPYCNYHEKLIIPRQLAVPENTDVSVENEDELGENDNYQNDDFEDDSGIGLGADEEEEVSEEEEANIVDYDDDDIIINP